ncbi:helix-turn-helix domain-containing protein [Ponticaulis sp.]|uniref:helix-turn-helix domain-containing protein n=1 Tax=Ponticaulis sp. TaxID=2020902 RepID=UPI0025FC5663|nr:helix-turn-helix domain-containing protein [Ponticaulis sp.]
MSIPENQIFTLSEAAEFLKISTKTLNRWDQQRIGPPRTKIGQTVYYQKSDIWDWIDRNKRTPVKTLRSVS